jgi:hypothetical protein
MTKDQNIVLSTSYFGPIQYFTKFLFPGQVYLEKYENFTKQTYRNRCRILGANGPLSLTVPVKRGSFHKVKISELEIEYQYPWQENHWRSIESAYRSSPFFEFYQEEIQSLFELKSQLLLDLNFEILRVILGLLRINRKIDFTENYCTSGYRHDFRDSIHPKKRIEDPLFKPVEYVQVFQPKFGFQTNLSVLDLLFNTGPDAKAILENSTV